MNDGIELDQQTLINTLQNKLAQAAVREAQMEAAIQQLMSQQNELMARIRLLEEEVHPLTEVADVTSADG